MRKERDQLVCKRRVGCLREPGEPLFIPGIEPMFRVGIGEEHVCVRVERAGRQLHKKQGAWNGHGQQYNPTQEGDAIGTRSSNAWGETQGGDSGRLTGESLIPKELRGLSAAVLRAAVVGCRLQNSGLR